MHIAQITINNPAGEVLYNTKHTAPASWSEMTRKHLLFWASTMGSGLKVEDAKINLVALLYKIPVKYFICIKRSDTLALRRSLDFLFKRNLLTTWLIPSIWRGLFKYYGPKNGLSNITIDEFSKCELCFERYQETKNVEYLETLMGILYRPQRFFGIDDDIRVKLTAHGYIKRAKRFKKLPEGVKYAVFLNYEGCRNFLHDKYKEVFTRGRSTGKVKKVEITPWPKIIEASASDIFGPLQVTKQTNLHEFLSRLGSRIMEAKEIQKHMLNKP